MLNAEKVKEYAFSIGFSKCGVAQAKPLEEARKRFEANLDFGYHAQLKFLEKSPEVRFNPELLLPNCKSVIVLLYNYIIDTPKNSQYSIAKYAWIDDYHKVLKAKIDKIVNYLRQEQPNTSYRITVDSSAISEKSWAVQAGVGRVGKNTLIHNENGSYYLIGTILTDCTFDYYDQPLEEDCGSCTLCIDNCPTHAIIEPFKLNAQRCISYNTIENKSEDYKDYIVGNQVFGCDICQDVCPRNSKKIINTDANSFSSLFLQLDNSKINQLTENDFKYYFSNSCIKRMGYLKFMEMVKRASKRDKMEQKEIIEEAKQVLTSEADAVKKLVNYIDESFVKCLEMILTSQGRLIITGVGKSALIGQKIVATLNSTGTPAVFMHAADAIHGDLGIIQPDDIVLCISKSGNTPEVSVLIPFLKRRGNKLIAMVGNINSFLATEADYVINCTIEREACPNNLAPTSSSTAQLAMGDAMASCLIQMRGFTPEDFAKYHPGGILGKKLYTKVSDLYKFNDIPMVLPTDLMPKVILEISGKCLGVTAVIVNNKIIGAITDGDLRRMLEKNVEYAKLTAQEVMTKNPKTINENCLATEALELMKKVNITNLFVVNDADEYMGVIHLHDIIKEGLL